MKNKKFILVLLIVLILTSSCRPISDKLSETVNNIGKEEDINKGAPVEGGEINLPLTNFSTLNPIITENNSYYLFTKLIYEGLFDFDDNLRPVGKLAESYSISNDGKVIDIKLNPNARWHDGQDLLAEDVIFTLNVIKKAGKDSLYGDLILEGLASYDKANLNTIINASGSGKNLKISFDRPSSNNLEVLTFPIIPKHRFKNIGDGLRKDNYELIGTGPFKFDGYVKMKELRLVANDDYREGRPYLDRITGKVLDNEEEVLIAFETGQVNMAMAAGIDWEKYGKNSRIRAVEYISGNYEFIGFNFRKTIFQGEEGKKLRQAIMLGIDREEIIDKVYIGHASIADLPIPPNSWLYQSKFNKYKLDKIKATGKLTEAGLVEKDEEGFYKDGDGKRISLDLLTNTLDPLRSEIAFIIKSNLKDIGIEVNIIPEETPIENRREEDIERQWDKVQLQMDRGNFDMVLSGWKLTPIPNLNLMFHSSKIGSGSNFIGYSNETTDNKLLLASSSGTSREDKKKTYKDLSIDLVENLPYASLLFRNRALLMDKKIQGDIKPNIFNPYNGIEKVYLSGKNNG